MSKSLLRSVSPLLVLGLLACGGGKSTPAPAPPAASTATTLHYTDKAGVGTDVWRLVVDPSTNDSSQVRLQLFGPNGMNLKGFTARFHIDPAQVDWMGADVATGVLNLSQGAAGSAQMTGTRITNQGADVQVAAYQKTGQATLGTAPLCRITLKLKAGLNPGVLTLSSGPGNGVALDGAGQEQPFAAQVGELSAR